MRLSLRPATCSAEVIPVVRSGRDLVGESRQVQGKHIPTFLLPILKLNQRSGDVQLLYGTITWWRHKFTKRQNKLPNTLRLKFVWLTILEWYEQATSD